jgi:shikimate kinase
MLNHKSNIVLIGMPGSGKSTIGVVLAKMTSKNFVDTDVIIQTLQGRSLQDIVDKEGHIALLKIEQDVLLNLLFQNYVIATGGSAVYSHTAMEHLKESGVIIFLNVDLPVLEKRISNFPGRGLVKRPDQTLADLFSERFCLYNEYADFTIECGSLTHDEICRRIILATGCCQPLSMPPLA